MLTPGWQPPRRPHTDLTHTTPSMEEIFKLFSAEPMALRGHANARGPAPAYVVDEYLGPPDQKYHSQSVKAWEDLGLEKSLLYKS